MKARTTVRPEATLALSSGDAALIDPTQRASTTIVEAVFVSTPNLPVGQLAAVETLPGKFVIGYRPEFYDREGAAEIARLVVGPFRDVTDEAMAEVTL